MASSKDGQKTLGAKIERAADTLYRILWTAITWVVVAVGGYLLFAVGSQYFSSSEVISVVVFINAMATITLWREALRKPPRPNKEFLKKLTRSEPITPKHNPPKVVGGDLSVVADEDDRRFFADFAPFAHVVNWWLADEHFGSRWRLQERPDGDVRLNVDFSDGPRLGRCYDVFYNQVCLGRLEIRPGYDYLETPRLITEIELNSVRLLHFDTITDFLGAVAMHTCDGKDKDSSNVGQAITIAATKALWQNQQITEFDDLDGQDWGDLELHLNGAVPDWYFNRRDALLKTTRAERAPA